MGVEALAREARPFLRGEALPAAADPILSAALDQVTSLYNSIASSLNIDDLNAWERGLRLYEGSVQAHLAGVPNQSSAMHAFRLLASAPHYWDVQQQLRTTWLPREEYAPRVHFTSIFNRTIRGYASVEPPTHARELISVMARVRHMIGTVACTGDCEPIFRSAVRGARYERWGKRIIEYAGLVEETETADDIRGVDVRLCIDKKKNKAKELDIASSKHIVQHKCKLSRPRVCGIRNKVLVLWPGITEPEMGDTFETDEDVAWSVYNRRIDGTTIRDILKEAKEDRRIRQVAWKKD